MKFIDVVTTKNTVGGYVFMGKLDNGFYFMCDDMYINFLDADPKEAGGDVYYLEWQQEHAVEFDVDYPHFFIQMCDWIKKNQPFVYHCGVDRLAQKAKRELFTTRDEVGYIPEMDTSVIFQYVYDDKGSLYSKEVIGWYQGEPNDEDTEQYKDCGLKAMFD